MPLYSFEVGINKNHNTVLHDIGLVANIVAQIKKKK